MMPAAEAARRDVDPLDADIGPIFRLELDPVAVPLHVVVQVPGGESRRDETDPRRAESDARKRSEDCSADDRALNFFLKRNTRIGSTSPPYFDRVVGQTLAKR